MIRWIAFDAVGTLIRPEPSVATAYYEVGRRFGSRMEIESIRARFHTAFAASEAEDAGLARGAAAAYSTSEEREFQRWSHVVRSVLPDVADAEACFDALWRHFAAPTSWRCFDDVAAAISRLSDQGLEIAIASNFDARLHAVCDALPALAPVRVRVVSSEVGFRKPGAGFYAALMKRLECSPDEVLVVGDDWENDVRGAVEFGLQAVFLDRNQELAPSQSEIAPRITSLERLFVG